jgi:DNA polymerase III epsilon subunit-like protein
MITYSDNGDILILCDKRVSGKVVIPNGVLVIKSHAFNECSEITEITLPNTLQKLERGAFKHCTSLISVNIPDSVKEIPGECFEDCINLAQIKLSSNLIKIGHDAFYNCQSLVSIQIPDSVRELGHGSFRNCFNLQQIRLPQNINSISSSVFSGCESIYEVIIPKNINRISTNAFKDCSELNCVIIESANIEIDPTAFIGCNHISRIYIKDFKPYKVLACFPDCQNIKYIAPLDDLPKGITKNALSLQIIQNQLSTELKYMSLYYRLFNMNITQMKWSECHKKNIKTFKEPIDTNWERYKTESQPLDYLFSLNWDKSSGIGLVLGYNLYRALDIDIYGDFILKWAYPNDGINGFINEILTQLHLPLDYPWVVRSGNGYGFHIIFKNEGGDATTGIDSLSFAPNDNYNNFGQPYFGRMELRWCDHLVLPPSLHASGLQYEFRNETLPTSAPLQVSLSEIDSMINTYCSEITVQEANYKGINIELADRRKITSRHDSYLSPHEHSANTIEWLEEVSTDDNKNSLALCHLLGRGIKQDSAKAINLLRESKSQTAIFNLLQLYACEFLEYNAKDYNELVNSLDITLFEGHMDVLNHNAAKYLPQIEKFLFFDTETTGLPIDYNAPSTDINNWPRLIQLSWIITDQFYNVLSKHNHIIKPAGFTIPNQSASVHGITTDYANINGENLIEILNLFASDLKTAKYIVGHNIDFDKKIIEAEFHRQNIAFSWCNTTSICTMKSSTDFCKIPNFYGYRYPKLQELYIKLFDVDFENAHDAFSDISATLKCFKEMVKRGIISIPKDISEKEKKHLEDNKDDVLPF